MSKILSNEELHKKIKFLKNRNKKIVLCHGVFDIIHPGHIYHFNSAKKFGDILIVSVTTDENVKKGITVLPLIWLIEKKLYPSLV